MKSLVAFVLAVIVIGARLPSDRDSIGVVRAQEASDAGLEVRLDTQSREALLARWNRLTPEEQSRMRERFERYQALSPEDQEALAARTRRIQARADIFYELFTSEERARLDRLTPEKKRAILITLSTEEEEEQASRVRATLPPELAEKLAEREPERRRAILDDLRRRQEEKLGPAIARLGLELGIDPKEIARLELLPFDQRKKKFFELAKELSTQHIASRELSAGLTAFRWEIMKQLEPEEFFAALLRLRAKHPELGWIPRRGPLPPGRLGPSEELRAAMLRIRAAGRIDEAELIELAPLSSEERRAEQTRRRRERVVECVRAQDWLSAETIEDLEQASDERFLVILRELTTPPRSLAHLPGPLAELRERLQSRAEEQGASESDE